MSEAQSSGEKSLMEFKLDLLTTTMKCIAHADKLLRTSFVSNQSFFDTSDLALFEDPRKKILALVQDILDPLLAGSKAECRKSIHTLLQEDYYTQVIEVTESPLVKNVQEEMDFLSRHVLSKFEDSSEIMGDYISNYCFGLAKLFVVYFCLILPLSELGVQQLCKDVSSIQEICKRLISRYTCQVFSFKQIEAFKTLLFKPEEELLDSSLCFDLGIINFVHIVLARLPGLSLPHVSLGWTKSQYVNWILKHSEEEAQELLQKKILSRIQSSSPDPTIEKIIGLLR
jgi:hypothetical protein